LQIARGATTGTITVTIYNDRRDEFNETFRVTLTTPTFATIADAVGIGTIVDND
jgi:hypothetical protein